FVPLMKPNPTCVKCHAANAPLSLTASDAEPMPQSGTKRRSLTGTPRGASHPKITRENRRRKGTAMRRMPSIRSDEGARLRSGCGRRARRLRLEVAALLRPLRPAATLHLGEREQRARVVVAQQPLARIPLPRFFDHRHAAAVEEVRSPSLRRLDQMSQLEDLLRQLPDLRARLLAQQPDAVAPLRAVAVHRGDDLLVRVRLL